MDWSLSLIRAMNVAVPGVENANGSSWNPERRSKMTFCTLISLAPAVAMPDTAPAPTAATTTPSAARSRTLRFMDSYLPVEGGPGEHEPLVMAEPSSESMNVDDAAVAAGGR